MTLRDIRIHRALCIITMSFGLLSLTACKDKTPAAPASPDEQRTPPSISAEPSTEQAVEAAKPVVQKAKEEAKPAVPTGKVAFLHRNAAGNSELFVIDLATSRTRRLYGHEDKANANVLHPRWSEDGQRIHFNIYEGDGWKRASIAPNGGEIQRHPDKPVDLISQDSRAPDILVEEGKLSIVLEDPVVIYEHEGYDFKNNPGPAEVSWGPNKQHVIFEVCGETGVCEVRITDLQGNVVRTIPGASAPDWTT